MSARDLLDRADFGLPPKENVADTLYMVDLLAAWIRVRSLNYKRAHATTLAGTILCPIFRTEKGPKYAEAADRFRSKFAGIGEDAGLAGDYLLRMKKSIIDLRTPADVFGRSFSDFFDDRFEEAPRGYSR